MWAILTACVHVYYLRIDIEIEAGMDKLHGRHRNKMRRLNYETTANLYRTSIHVSKSIHMQTLQCGKIQLAEKVCKIYGTSC